MSTSKAIALLLVAASLLWFAWMCFAELDMILPGLLTGSLAAYIVGYVSGRETKC